MKDVNIIVPKNIQVGDTGTIWSLPNYDGELYTADDLNTRFLNIIGGLNGGLDSNNFEFPTSSLYSLEAISQPAITETQAVAGATPSHVSRDQSKNVCQIFQKAINVSYVKQANQGRLSGINSANAQNNVQNEVDFQITVKLQTIARMVNYTFHNGSYQISTSADVANKTRGMLANCGTSVDASGAQISKVLVDQLLREMYTNGATFNNVVIFTGVLHKQQITEIYGLAPRDRNVGGLNINQIETDLGPIGIVLERDMPVGSVGFYDVSVCAPVFNPVPEKGRLFYEPLARTGASEKGQLYGHIGLDHGPSFMHGKLTNLKTT